MQPMTDEVTTQIRDSLVSSSDRYQEIKSMAEYMLSAQEELNVRLFPDWRERNLDWDTAILIEAAELIDHTPWKWWKTQQETDWDQVRMEAVDVWHFILSKLLEGPEPSDCVADALTSVRFTDGLVSDVNGLVHAVVAKWGEVVVCNRFFDVMASLGMTFDDLFRLYVGKAELNRLRWESGYGTTYKKDWLGEEDNQYLTKLLESLTSSGQALVDDVRLGLQKRYDEVLAL